MYFGVSSGLDYFVDSDFSNRELTDKTLSDLRSTFSQYGHAPSEAMWVGIRALIDALEGMANGTLHHLPYLSPLDPGVGKTEVVVHFIRNLIASPSYGDVGGSDLRFASERNRDTHPEDGPDEGGCRGLHPR